MEAKQGFILVICSMILAGEVACFPTDIRAKSSFSQDDATALAKYEDWRAILKKIPKFLFPILRKILKGIANSEDPMEILMSILGGEKPSKKKKKKNRKKKNKNKKKNNKENNENENEENKEEEPEPEENSGSEKPENESQE